VGIDSIAARVSATARTFQSGFSVTNRKRSIMRATLVLSFLGGLALRAGDPGRVQYELITRPDFDRYTNSPNRSQQQWLQQHFARMVGYTSYFDSRTSWFPRALVYFDLYGVHTDSPVAQQHPDWLLRDASGKTLYVPWGCANGTCPQFAADVGNPQYRAWWIQQAKSLMRRGYLGLYIDDVNMEFRVSDGTGKQIPPIDSRTGQSMSWDEWRKYVADFVQQIHEAVPGAEITHNSIWFAGPAGVRDRDPAIERQIKSADHIIVERGIASDPGLTGGNGEWSLQALLAYIDRVHALGRGVTLEEYKIDDSSREYALAGYFLISSGNDLYSDSNGTPDNWWIGYDVDLGTPVGPRTYHDGVFQRKFSCGMVLLGEPGLHAKTVTLEAPFSTLDGRSVRSVELSSRVGAVLRSCGSEQPSKAGAAKSTGR
jgi:putative glycosyl hydrolase-like family 15 (GHL15) protein